LRVGPRGGRILLMNTTETVLGRSVRNLLNGQIGTVVKLEEEKIGKTFTGKMFWHVRCGEQTFRLLASKVEWA
jgi:hypothetical protein